MKLAITRVLIAFFVVALAGLFLMADDPLDAAREPDADKPGDTKAIHKQKFLKDQFKKLVGSMLKVADLLQETEPESARAIRAAVEQAQQSLIEDNMDRVIEYLHKGLTAMAGTVQETVLRDLKEVLAKLESSTTDLDEEMRRIKQWEQTLERLKKLTEEEREHHRRSHVADRGSQLAGKMQALGKKLQGLIERQKELLEATRKLPEPDALVDQLGQARDEIRRLIADQTKLNDETAKATMGGLLLGAETQKDVKGRTGKVAGKLGKLAEDPKVGEALSQAGAGANAAKAAASHVGNAAGEMGKSADKLEATDAPGARPHQEQAVHDLQQAEKVLTAAIRKLSAGSKAGGLAQKQADLRKDTAQLSGEVKDAMAASSPGGKDGGEGASQDGQEGNLDRAAEHMSRAADQLDRQGKHEAGKSQVKAIEEMQGDALRLAELSRKILKEAQEADLSKMKQDQDVTGEKTRDLSEKMKGPEGGKPTPGQGAVASARTSMQQASKSLGGGNASSASQEQGKAVNDLQRAEDELSKAIEQAREAAQEEALAKLDAILGEVLNAQKKITRTTIETYGKRVNGEYQRPEKIELAKLSDGEGELSKKMDKVLEMVRSEGTTAVFPVVLDETRGDLSNVQKLLALKKAGPLTQVIQKDIEKSLEEMIDALRREMRRRRQQGGVRPGGGGGGRSPLVSPVAELKMLRTLQKQINGRTIRLDGQARAGVLSETESKVQHKILADREGKLVKMTTALAQKNRAGGGPPAAGETR